MGESDMSQGNKRVEFDAKVKHPNIYPPMMAPYLILFNLPLSFMKSLN